MARRGKRDRGKEHFWRHVLRQWRRSGQGVRRYCAEHGLSEPSFYAWRRTLQERDRQAQPQPTRGPVSAGQVLGTGVPRGHAQPRFEPVTVLTPAPALEVVCRDGRVVRVPPGFEPTALRQVLAVLAEASPC